MNHMIFSGYRERSGFPGMKLFSLLILVIITRFSYSQNEFDVIRNSWLQYTDAQNSLYHHLTGQACHLLKQRTARMTDLQTVDDWQKRQKQIRETLMDIVGPFPEKTSLNARIVRRVEKKDFRIEHIVFESQPGFYVTSSLFIPAGLKKRTRAPAVIYCSGHTVEGYRSAIYLHVIQNLVKKGFIVFAFDPVGQGERLEYFDPETGRSSVGGPTKEHSYPGAQAFIAGSSQAMYMIWDGIRAVDYLISRREVDPSRIGITGRSGGGTQSAYIGAFDDRIYAVAPENYITNYTRLLQSIGPQDAEQNMFNIISRGLDHPDFLIVRAPKPAMMITTTNDFFSIQGARETEKEVKSIYNAYGAGENFSRVEDDTVHASTLKNRQAMYAFFQKHLDNPGNPFDEETGILDKEEVQVTETGQVSTSLGGETVFSQNLKFAEKLEENLNESRKNPESFFPQVISSAKTLSGYREPSEYYEPVFAGTSRKKNYTIEKYFVRGEGEYVIPYLLFRPEKPVNKVLLYLHPSGKASEASDGGKIEYFVDQGITVVAPDMVGTGETGEGSLRGDADFDGASHNLWYASMLIGRSITGILASDIVRLVRVIKKSGLTGEITGMAEMEMAPALLHAACFAPEITGIILAEPYSSFRSIVMNRSYDPRFIQSTVPGALMGYDLSDLAAVFAPRPLFIAGATDGQGSGEDAPGIMEDLEIIKAGYRYKNAGKNLQIIHGESFSTFKKLMLDWVR